MQLLFATGKSFTVDGLHEKLREFFRQEARAELRAVAALNNVELITARSFPATRSSALSAFSCGFSTGWFRSSQQRSTKALGAYLSEQGTASGGLGLTPSALEVLACIAFNQPISQAEIDRLFDADKRGLVVKMRDLKLVEEFAGSDGRLRFATTEAFLQRFGLASLGELTSVQFLGSPPSTHPLILTILVAKPLCVFGAEAPHSEQKYRM